MEQGIVVIQCAGRKSNDAGSLGFDDGRKALFVAKPDQAPEGGPYIHAHPDGADDKGESWRKKLLRYNDIHRGNADGNPLGLLPAWQLYQNPAYGLLYRKYGADGLYILSAGWGLIPTDFLTPTYDITFKSGAEQYQRRYMRDIYDDFRMLPDDTAQPVIFFGGKDYVGLFCELTSRVRGPRVCILQFNRRTQSPGLPNQEGQYQRQNQLALRGRTGFC